MKGVNFMEWTREQKYRKLEDVTATEIKQLEKQVAQCPWRQAFHIQPKTGLLNDPNGLAFYQGEYHVFYQWFPLGPVHGLKYWYHLKSTDLINWQDLGIGIAPDQYYENYGAYSGSGFEHDGDLYLMYTGNNRDEDLVRHPMQAIAIMKPNGHIKKLSEPVIKDVPDGYTDHFRDPKVWEQDGAYYAIIGAQRQNKTGCTVLYRSTNAIDWTFLGEMKTELDNFGYMWECPDYFELENKGVLIFSPQGLNPEGDKYQNIYQTGYFIGEPLNLETKEFHHGEFHELDYGFDFYAPQSTEGEDGRRIVVGWLGLPEVDYPTDRYGWAHCLTLPRELKMVNGKLYQVPVRELEALRKDGASVAETVNSEVREIGAGVHYELECEFTNIEAAEIGLSLRAGEGEETVFKYDTVSKKIILDRTNSGEAVGTEFGTVRKTPYNSDKIKIRLFMDTSSLEIFVNDGEYAFTSRIFPTNDENKINIFAKDGSCDFQVQKWNLGSE